MFTFNLLYAALLAAPARAGGYSTDIELLRPGFTPGGLPGVDNAAQPDPGSWRVGMLTQLEADPLVLYDSGYEIGAIIEDRVASHLGLTYGLASRASVSLLVPSYLNSGTQTPAMSAGGAGLGDLSVAARFRVLRVGPLSAGLRTELTAPTGRKEAYMGEDGLRTGAALLASLDTDRVGVLLDAGAVARSAVETDADVTFGSELVVNAGLRLSPVPERLSLYGGVLSRSGFANFWQAESGENPVEAIGGLQLAPTDQLTIDLGGGRGLTDGYGTTERRMFAGATWQIGEREPDEEGFISDPGPEPEGEPVVEVKPPVEPPPEPFPESGPSIDGDEILLTEPILFVHNTAEIRPDSAHVLLDIAALLNSDHRIGQVVIVGHASDDGSHAYNYQLSLMRAMSVYQALYRAGVHPERMSFRPRGEVDGEATTSESEMAAERKVEFHITQWLTGFEIETDHSPQVLDPETGEIIEVSVPEMIIPEAPDPDHINLELFQDDEDE